MPYKDPAKRAEAVRRHRARKGAALKRLAEDVKDAGGLPDPPTRDFLLKALGLQAREGNVPAIRLLLEEYRRDGDIVAKSAKSVVDQLAAKRATRAG